MWRFCVEIIGTLRANESSGQYKMGATFCLSPDEPLEPLAA
jgi:hypothetical protein